MGTSMLTSWGAAVGGLAFVLLAWGGGVASSAQMLVNARLAHHAGAAYWAVAVSTGITFAVSLALAFSIAGPVALQKLAAAPWWAWCGGLLGVAFMLAGVASIPQLGVAPVMVLLVAGQLCGALLLDHLRLSPSSVPIDSARLFGLALVVAGAWLIVKR
jgi:bacterial/archaeal transporter family-2 protein